MDVLDPVAWREPSPDAVGGLAQRVAVSAPRSLRPRAPREEVLHGTVRALAEILALADPVAYTQALRVQEMVVDVFRTWPTGAPFELQTAALLSPLGSIGLPSELQRRVSEGEPLNVDDQRILACLPQLTDRLLAPIPGLEEVRSVILLRHRQPLPAGWRDRFGDARHAELVRMASALRLASVLDSLIVRGFSLHEAFGLLRGQAAESERELVESLARLHAADGPKVEMRSLPISRLRSGMRIAEAVYTSSGQLLVNRGFEIDDAFVEKVRNYKRGQIREPVQVILPPARTRRP